MSTRTLRTDSREARGFEEDGEAAAVPALSREQAESLRQRAGSLSPWRVVAAQAVLGVLVAALAWWITGEGAKALSALYGAAVVVLPAALMARGASSPLSRMSPGSGAVSFMFWEVVKISVAVAMLVMAPQLVQPLSWPALLVAMVLCMKVYWFALLWRGR